MTYNYEQGQKLKFSINGNITLLNSNLIYTKYIPKVIIT